MIHLRIFVFLLLCPVLAFAAGGEKYQVPLKVYYLEFPPYYYTNSDFKPDGFLLKQADTIFRQAGIEPEYESLPAKRILQEMRTLRSAASIGWFKTPQRERFASFSIGLYQNKPLQVMFLKANELLFHNKETLAELLKDDSLTLGLVEGYSYGHEVDGLIEKEAPQTQLVVGGYPQLVRLLAAGQFTYIVVAPEEVDMLIGKNRLAPELLECKKLKDMPAGNVRHLIFSKGVPDDIVNRVNRAVKGVKN